VTNTQLPPALGADSWFVRFIHPEGTTGHAEGYQPDKREPDRDRQYPGMAPLFSSSKLKDQSVDFSRGVEMEVT
jgi:hypothetical protein